jgi:uncharacterized membrane protein YhaH (DUF805 family)
MQIGSLFLAFSGRLDRRRFWIASVGYLIVVGGLTVLVLNAIAVVRRTLNPSISPDAMQVSLVVPTLLVLPFLLYPLFALSVKRLHDRDRPGWWAIVPPAVVSLSVMWLGVLIGARVSNTGLAVATAFATFIVVLAHGWLFFEVGLYRGMKGPNSFGPDPQAPASLDASEETMPPPLPTDIRLRGELKRLLQLLLDFEGRARRQELWAVALFVLGAEIAVRATSVSLLFALNPRLSMPEAVASLYPAMVLIDALLFCPLAAITVRRMHDRDRSGWWALLYLLPVYLFLHVLDFGRLPSSMIGFGLLLAAGAALVLAFAIDLGWWQGTPGPNRFGPDPRPWDSDLRAREVAALVPPPVPAHPATRP